MLKKLLKISTIASLAMALHTQAQTQVHPLTGATITGAIVTSIAEVQTIIGSRLALCDDKSPFLNMTVTVRGRMVAPGRVTFPAMTIDGIAYPTTTVVNAVGNGGQELYIQQGMIAGLSVRRSGSGTSKNYNGPNLTSLLAGDSVEITGNLNEFRGMSQLEPINVSIIGVNSIAGLPALVDGNQLEGIAPLTISNLGNLNNSNRINNLEDGEKYEGMYVELRNVRVQEVSPAPPYTNASRPYIVLVDDDGNQVIINDRFKAGRLAIGSSTSSSSPVIAGEGRLIVPLVGQKYKSIKGMLYHAKTQQSTNGCSSATGEFETFPAASYQIHPWHPSQFDLDPNFSPIISSVSFAPLAPSTSSNITISANVSPQSSFNISSAGVYFSTDTLNYDSWSSVAMTSTGNQFSANIPNTFADGQMVFFYVVASDNRGLTSVFPNVPTSISGIKGNSKPNMLVVRNGGLTIKDIQYTPFSNGRSPYEGKVVTVSGIVTATVKDGEQNMSNVVIQQENATEWAGLLLQTNSLLSNAAMGSKITVQGRVTEITAGGASTFTTMDNIASVVANGTGSITPLTLSVNTFSGAYNFKNHEKFEGMLVKLVNPIANENLFVVDANADSDPRFTSNTQGEYRIGTDTMTIKNLATTLTGAAKNTLIAGTRVLTGRNSSATSPNSQYVSLIAQQTTATGSAQKSIVEANTGVNAVIASSKVSFKSMTGIVQHSFGNMKLLPRNNADIELISILGVTYSFTGQNTPDRVVANIYPNPTSGQLNIDFTNSGSYLLEIANIQGQSIYQEKINTSKTTVDLSTKNAGVYILKITNTNSGFSYFQKLILK